MKRLIAFAALSLAAVGLAEAKLAPERWGRLTEEERHQLTRAERYFDQNQFKNAAAEYELFLQLYERSENASYAQLMYAECIRRQGQINTAMEEFRNVLDYFPDSPDSGEAQYSIALCLRQGGDAEKAAAAFEKVIEKWPKTGFAARSRNELLPIYWRQNKRDKWLPHLEYLANGEYSDPEGLRGQAQRRLFTHRLAQGQVAEALALVQGIQKKDPIMTFADWSIDAIRSQELRQTYGETMQKALPGIGTATMAVIEKEAAADPARKKEYELRLARLLAATGARDKAIERYQALADAAGDNDGLRVEFADYLRGQGKRNEARLVYRSLKDTYRADRTIADSYGEENNWDQCIKDYKAMLEKYPNKSNELQWRLGELLQRTGKYEEAIAAYQQSQQEPQALFRIAECQNSLKQHDAAIQTLTGVVNFFKDSAAEAQYRIGGSYAAAGNKDAAIRTLKLVCEAYKNSPWAGRAHEELTLKYGVQVTLGGVSKKKDS